MSTRTHNPPAAEHAQLWRGSPTYRAAVQAFGRSVTEFDAVTILKHLNEGMTSMQANSLLLDFIEDREVTFHLDKVTVAQLFLAMGY